MKTTFLILVVLLSSVLLYDCKKSSTSTGVSNLSSIKVHLGDAPAILYGEVNIDVIGV